MNDRGGRYCVIGAGAAGLAALRELIDAGFDVDCFERTEQIGGHWNDDYDSLHLITSRDTSGFPGYPMPTRFPTYPSRSEMVEYLNAFCDGHQLREKITFGTEVVSCQPEGPQGHDGWRVTTTHGTTQLYDGVIVANGHLWNPRVPDVANSYTGTSIHSKHYRNSSQIQGSRVLVVGAGNSGCDLAVDVALAGLTPKIVVRRGLVFQPKSVFGKPRAELSWLTSLPRPLQERVNRLLVRIVIGPHSAYAGLPAPQTPNLNKLPPVVNTLLPYYIQHGRVAVAPAIQRIDGKTVFFENGDSETYDTILWATGFEVTFPFLDCSLMEWANGVPLRVAAMTLPIGLKRLYFVGLSAPRGPQLPPYVWQASLVAQMLTLDSSHGSDWSASAFADEQPDNRIDIVRVDWMKQLKRARRTVDSYLRTNSGTPRSRKLAVGRGAP